MFIDRTALELEARREIYECIRKSPGLHFREIQRRVSLATGSLDYHLHYLKKNSLIRSEKSGKFLRYYPTDEAFSEEEKELLGLLRQEKIRHILIYLIENNKAKAGQIAEDLGISPSSLSRYLNKLTEKGVIRQQKKGRYRIYSVPDKRKIVSALVTHKKSFLDKLVNRFIEAWEE